jgi:hypothetical protein
MSGPQQQLRLTLSRSSALPGHQWDALIIAVAYDTDYIFGTVLQIDVNFGGGTIQANFLGLGSASLSAQTIELWVLTSVDYGPEQVDWQGLTVFLTSVVNNLHVVAFGISYISPGTGGISDQSATDGTTSPVTASMTPNVIGGSKFTIPVDPADCLMLTFACVREGTGITLTSTAGTELTRVSSDVSPNIFTTLVGYVTPMASGANTITWTESANRSWLHISLVSQPPVLGEAMTARAGGMIPSIGLY